MSASVPELTKKNKRVLGLCVTHHMNTPWLSHRGQIRKEGNKNEKTIYKEVNENQLQQQKQRSNRSQT